MFSNEEELMYMNGYDILTLAEYILRGQYPKYAHPRVQHWWSDYCKGPKIRGRSTVQGTTLRRPLTPALSLANKSSPVSNTPLPPKPHAFYAPALHSLLWGGKWVSHLLTNRLTTWVHENWGIRQLNVPNRPKHTGNLGWGLREGQICSQVLR